MLLGEENLLKYLESQSKWILNLKIELIMEFDVPLLGAEIVISGGMSVPQILTTVDARAIPTGGIEKLCKTKSMAE